MNTRRTTLKLAFAIFVALTLLVFAIAGIAARYGRAWSVSAYKENLRQNIRELAAKEQYGAIERVTLSVLKVSPEYEATVREEIADYQHMLPELSAMLRGELSQKQ